MRNSGEIMEINFDKTNNGTDRCIVRLDNGDVFKGYKNGNNFQFNGRNGQQGICTLNKKQIKTVFEKANAIADFGGKHLDYLKTFKTQGKKGNQSVSSDDGLYKFGYYFKKGKGIIVYAMYDKNERRIRPILSFEEEDNAKLAINEAKKEYDSTGKFKSYRTSLRGNPFPPEYSDNNDVENLNLDNSYYESVLSYILNGFDKDGNSELAPNETLHICCVDGYKISLEDTDSLRVNDANDMLIIHICDAPDNEIIVPITMVSRVLLTRE